jgi:hypothetical protein
MGRLAACSMAGTADALSAGLHFELFTHCTRFLGTKVVLLGLYNGQRLAGEPEQDVVMYVREDDDSFVRVLLLRGRLQGAVMLGDTDLEEVRIRAAWGACLRAGSCRAPRALVL